MNNLTRKKVNFKWMELCEENFEKIKKCLINPPILKYHDFSKEFVLHVHKRWLNTQSKKKLQFILV